jgi:hypothetical protein
MNLKEQKTIHLNRTVYDSIDQKLNFGKYKDHTIRDICNFDPNYLLWINENIRFAEITDELLLIIKCKCNK